MCSIYISLSSYSFKQPFFQDNLGKPAPERQNHSGYNEARDDGVAEASAGSCANDLHLASDTGRQLTMPAPHHSSF